MCMQGGEIRLPDTPYSTFYLSQRPYLITGSLRDQILYPHPPAAVWETASAAARRPFEQLPVAHLTEEEQDERLEAVIEAVELDYLLGRYRRGLPAAKCRMTALSWVLSAALSPRLVWAASPSIWKQGWHDITGIITQTADSLLYLACIPWATPRCESHGSIMRLGAQEPYLTSVCSEARGGMRSKIGARR